MKASPPTSFQIGDTVIATHDHQPFFTTDPTIHYRAGDVATIIAIVGSGALQLQFADGRIPTVITETLGRRRRIAFIPDHFLRVSSNHTEQGSNVRLLLIACSATKRQDPGLMPAIERYDGPTYRTLRKWMHEHPDAARRLRVLIISAKYGIIEANRMIENYDHKMDKRRAIALTEQITTEGAQMIDGCTYQDALINLGQDYSTAAENFIATVRNHSSTVEQTYGGIGDKTGQMKRWLESAEQPDWNAVFEIIKRCGAEESQREHFLITARDQETFEFRFFGKLGLGGKIYRGARGTQEGARRILWVSCYNEDRTPERKAIIDSANKDLRAFDQKLG